MKLEHWAVPITSLDGMLLGVVILPSNSGHAAK